MILRGDKRILVTAGWDGKVRLFNAKKLEPLAILRHHSSSVYDVAYGPAPQWLLASASKDTTIALWSLYS